MPLSMSDYQAPSFLDVLAGKDGVDNRTLGRMKEILETGRAFVESEPAWNDIPRAMEIIGSDAPPSRLSGYSTISINRIKRNTRDLVATIANLKPSGKALTRKTEAQDSCWRLNQMKEHWWTTTFADRKYREACQYACILGTGYLEPWWDPNFYGYGRGEIAVKTRGPSGVLPVMMTEDHDLQKAYAVTTVDEVPLHIVLANYPAYAHLITPTRSIPGWINRAINRYKSRRAVNGVLGSLDTPQHSIGQEMPVVDVYTTYIMDQSLNNTRQEIMMGDPGSSWAYRVPYIGQEIPAGIRDRRGNPIMKLASAEDCRMFPLRRRVIWTDTCILKDGTSPYLHGRVPLVQLRFDDYPWDFLGTSIVHDTWRIQKATNQIWRAIIDSVLVRLQPPLKYDSNVIDPKAMARINTRIPAQTIEASIGMGNPVEPLLPVQFWDVPPWILQVLQALNDQLDQLSVVKDLMAVAKAKQVPSADSIEKILESAGPVVQDIARGGEKATCEFDQLFYPLALQFWDANKVFHILGEDGALKETIDFDPGNLIPSHLPGEDQSNVSQYDKWERARWALEQMSYHIEPFSQAQVSRIGRNLILMQLWKAQLPIGPWTLMKNMGLDPGEAKYNGEVAKNQVEEFILWKQMSADIAQQMQSQMGGGNQKGRPPTNAAPPQIKTKDQGMRSTIATSR